MKQRVMLFQTARQGLSRVLETAECGKLGLEGIVVGLARNRRRIETISSADEFIRSRISKFWDEPIAEELRGAGMRGTTRVQKSIPFGEKWFNPEFYD